MDQLKLWKAVEMFLQRTPIKGAEAETMVLCRQLVRQQQLKAAPPPPDLPARAVE